MMKKMMMKMMDKIKSNNTPSVIKDELTFFATDQLKTLDQTRGRGGIEAMNLSELTQRP